MKFLMTVFLIINPLTFIAEINQLLTDANNAYQRRNYAIAINRFVNLIENYEIEREEVLLNLAHCYFQIKDADKAAFYYAKILEKGSNYSQSVALNQLGYIAEVTQNPEKALDYFKQAILKNPQNFEARYNYELVRKRLQTNTLQNASNAQKNNSKSEQNEVGKDKLKKIEKKVEADKGEDKTEKSDNEEKENKKNLQPQKLEEAKLNREKAEAILEALKNKEAQYIQQLPKKKSSKNSGNKNIPDW